MTNEKLKTGQWRPDSELSFIVRFTFFILRGGIRAFRANPPAQRYFFVTT